MSYQNAIEEEWQISSFSSTDFTKNLRIRRNLLQKQIAEYYKNSETTISRIENGFQVPRHHIDLSEDLLKELQDMKVFDKGINSQFWLLCKSRIAYLNNEPEDKIIDMINQAIRITYANFVEDEFNGVLLISEEIELVYTLACAYEKKGSRSKAIQLL